MHHSSFTSTITGITMINTIIINIIGPTHIQWKKFRNKQ